MSRMCFTSKIQALMEENKNLKRFIKCLSLMTMLVGGLKASCGWFCNELWMVLERVVDNVKMSSRGF